MWHGRFQEKTAELVAQLGESISFDWQLFREDIAGSKAHAAVLVAAGILSEEERVRIVAGLDEIGHEIAEGRFVFKPELEDIHMNIEAELSRRIGAPGAKLHTARSRNDQVATDVRLYVKRICAEVREAIADLQRSLHTLGAAYPSLPMPGYTHLQRAQPVVWAHHLLAYVEMLARDAERFADCAKRADVMPLGSGAIAGSTISLPREVAREKLGFRELSRNSMDAISDRDFVAEFLFAASLTGVHLSRLSEDIILWASAEFNFVEIGDAFTTGSSLMPQKKNPDVSELTRGSSGRLIGNLVSMLTILKGLPMTYNRDLQHDKEPLFESAKMLLLVLRVNAEMLLHVKPREEQIRAAVADPMLLATDLADFLVRRGLPFRQAHEAVGKLVALSVGTGTPLNELTPAQFAGVHELFTIDALEVLSLETSLAARVAVGAPSPIRVAEQLAFWKEKLDQG